MLIIPVKLLFRMLKYDKYKLETQPYEPIYIDLSCYSNIGSMIKSVLNLQNGRSSASET
jgi:hypothetical protein